MKKLLVLATVVSMAFFSCKDKEEDPDNGGGTTAPQIYTQKVLLEYTTCAGCTYCPNGPAVADQLTATIGSNSFYSVAMHNNGQGADAMANAESKAFSDLYSAGNPTGMFNRIGGKSISTATWPAKGLEASQEIAKCGLAINTVSTGINKFTVTVKVGVGKKDLPSGNYYVIGYLVNKEMTGIGSGWDQVNGVYNTQAGHPAYQKGNPWKNYIHHNVMVKTLGGLTGKLVDEAKTKAGSLSEYTFDVDLSGVDISKMDVIAFLYFKSLSAPYVENVQRVKLGENKAFD